MEVISKLEEAKMIAHLNHKWLLPKLLVIQLYRLELSPSMILGLEDKLFQSVIKTWHRVH